MKVHILGLVHTETTREYEWCAFTSKARKLASMLTSLGIEVVLYAGEENEAHVAEHVPIVSRAEQAEWFSGYDWSRDSFNEFEPTKPFWQAFNERAVLAIRERAEPGDILGITMGLTHQPVASMLPDLLPVEVGVGYTGVWAPFRVYESRAWRTFLAAKAQTDDVRFYDEVIPNFFEVDAFPAGEGHGGYFLYIGRVMGRKGPQIAAEACRRIGARLIVAGQGVVEAGAGRIVATDGTVLEGDVEYVGVVGPEDRAKLMGGAIATFVPTMYVEPFGGVSVESQMCGTPAIVSDWGGLPENVVDGRTGYRCSMLRDFVRAAEEASGLDRFLIRQHAQETWATSVLRHRYAAYFDRLGTLQGAGWYS